MELDSTIVAALITTVGAVAIAVIGALTVKVSKYKKQRDQAENEMVFATEALSFDSYLIEWNELHKELETLFKDTNICRFSILRAWNGSLDPKWTTQSYSIKSDSEAKPTSYVHFQLDHDFVQRLRTIVDNGSTSFTVSEIDPSYIKDVYELEGVKQSFWSFIDKKRLGSTNNYSITYCCFSSAGDEPLTRNEITQASLIVNRLKGLSSVFNSETDNHSNGKMDYNSKY